MAAGFVGVMSSFDCPGSDTHGGKCRAQAHFEEPADSCRLTMVTNIRATGRFRPPVDFQPDKDWEMGNN